MLELKSIPNFLILETLHLANFQAVKENKRLIMANDEIRLFLSFKHFIEFHCGLQTKVTVNGYPQFNQASKILRQNN